MTLIGSKEPGKPKWCAAGEAFEMMKPRKCLPCFLLHGEVLAPAVTQRLFAEILPEIPNSKWNLPRKSVFLHYWILEKLVFRVQAPL